MPARLSRTFQNLRLFEDLDLVENVLIGLHPFFLGHLRLSWLAALLGFSSSRNVEHESRVRALEMLGVVGLKEHAFVKARDLPYGLKKRLELARALVAERAFYYSMSQRLDWDRLNSMTFFGASP